MTFCPGCGKKTERGKRFCIDCSPLPDIEIKDFTMKLCSDCNRYLHKSTWKNYNDLSRSIERLARDNIKGDKDGVDIQPVFDEFEKKPGTEHEVLLKITKDGGMFEVPIRIEITYCDRCSKKQGDYLEGVFQLRNIDEGLHEFISKYLKKNHIFVSKEKRKGMDFDLNITDKRGVQGLGHMLQKNFGGKLKVSQQLFSHDKQTSKDIYRVNVYYEAPDYKKGDAMKIEGKLVLIKGIKKNVTGIDLKTGKKASVNPEGKEYVVLKSKKTTVSRTYPSVEVLDPETYQSIELQNQDMAKNLNPGQNVKIIDDSGRLYVI